MNSLQSISCWTLVLSAMALVVPQAVAQEEDSDKITEQDKKVFQEAVAAQEAKARQTLGVTNLRRIGLALFEFETEYGSFPNEETAAYLKQQVGAKVEFKSGSANDCFFQLIAAGIVQTDRIFLIGDPKKVGEPEARKELDKVVETSFSYVSGMHAAGNPSRPVVVAPLVNGETTFDPKVLGGKAIVLRVDNSVSAIPIEKDGRVMVDGKDIFDPAQPFWNGKVPPIKWPDN